MNLEEFDRELRRVVTDERVRPFVCDGSPLSCQVFIVGANPATDVGFWEFWSAENGFDRERWRREYEDERRSRGKPGTSPTRQCIERVRAAAHPIRCLETNAYVKASDRTSDLGLGERATSVLSFLVETIRPRVVLAHGLDAQRAVDAALLTTGARTQVVRTRHLRLMSHVAAEGLGRQLAALAA